ncbi:MAG: alpha/beta fold hydrolase [Candidatus Eisenbacteria bacterium]
MPKRAARPPRGRPRSRPRQSLLHSGGMTRREWDPYLAELSAQHRLIVPTALAHGASPRREQLTIRSMGESVLQLLDALGISRAHILGSSMGGATAPGSRAITSRESTS